MTKKALVFIDYDIIVRHFIMADAFRELERKYDVLYVFHKDTTSDKLGIYHDPSDLGLKNYVEFELPRWRMGSWYKIFAVTSLHRQMGTSNYWPLRQRIAKAIGSSGWWRSLIFCGLALPGIFPIFRQRYLKRQGLYEPLLEFIKKHAPDIILAPSLLAGYFINDLGLIAKKLGIPYVAMMNSWDNPSLKAIATELPDRLVVWGEQTRRHAITYMGMEPDKVVMFGASQFQIYRNPVTESDSELRQLFEVPEHLPIILYAGVSKSINETRHLKLLDHAIADGSIPPCHILYRPHPWRGRLIGGEESFFDIGFHHISIDPHLADRYRNISNKPTPVMEMASYDVTRKLMHLITAAISPLSTMMLEVIMHEKPVLSYFPKEDRDSKFGKATKISFRLAHFQGFFDCLGVRRCGDRSELPGAVKKLMDDAKSPEVRKALCEHADFYVVRDGPTYAERVLDLANELVGSRDRKPALDLSGT